MRVGTKGVLKERKEAIVWWNLEMGEERDWDKKLERLRASKEAEEVQSGFSDKQGSLLKEKI